MSLLSIRSDLLADNSLRKHLRYLMQIIDYINYVAFIPTETKLYHFFFYQFIRRESDDMSTCKPLSLEQG